MARLQLCVGFEDIPLAVNSYKTVASVKMGADQVGKVLRVKLAGDGISGDAEPLGFRLQRITAASGTGTTTTPARVNETNGTTIRSTCRTNFTVEPTAIATGPNLLHDKFHPQGGLSNDGLLLIDCEIAAASEIAVQIKVPSGGTAIMVSGHVVYEE